jgi:hypothetical protein
MRLVSPRRLRCSNHFMSWKEMNHINVDEVDANAERGSPSAANFKSTRECRRATSRARVESVHTLGRKKQMRPKREQACPPRRTTRLRLSHSPLVVAILRPSAPRRGPNPSGSSGTAGHRSGRNSGVAPPLSAQTLLLWFQDASAPLHCAFSPRSLRAVRTISQRAPRARRIQRPQPLSGISFWSSGPFRSHFSSCHQKITN